MSILKCDSFVPYNNIKLKMYYENETPNTDITVSCNINKHYKNNEFKHLYDKYFLQKQNTVLDIIEELRELDSTNGTDIFKNVLYLNLYDLLYR